MINRLDELEQEFVDRIIIFAFEKVDNLKIDRREKYAEMLQIIKSRLDSLNLLGKLNDNEFNEIKNEIQNLLGVEDDIRIIDEEYIPWLEDIRTTVDWVHRDRYYRYLKDLKKWDNLTIRGSIDKTTDIILDHLANPCAEYGFVKKGMVVGEIQSGKTSNYIGLVNKAFDVGYQFVIVLAGMQNDLRTQTQERIDKEVLGYETNKEHSLSGVQIGVGKMPKYFADIESLTSRESKGDYKKKNGVQLFNDQSSKKIAVVKKNTTVLQNLYDDISNEVNLINGKFNVPVLIIDDEVDQASVNTKKDPELDPTRINGHIRNIINICNRVAYVGYTATPFANIFINNVVENETFGKDLFPKDFIVYLPIPKNYCGVNEFFGKTNTFNTELIELVDDYMDFCSNDEDFDKYNLKSDDEIENIPLSLKNAIDDFIVASAIRKSRIQKPIHNGMMIHIAQYKRPATSLRDLIEDYVYELQNEYRYDKEQAVLRYKGVYKTRFENVSQKYNHFDVWNDIQDQLRDVFELLNVKLLNGDSKDIVDYSSSEQSQIIAIGGNKLSRGITLEGLMISYYLRSPRAYDTAFQMGRWFGYKKTYIDLCRIYTQIDTISNFIHMMDASNELREQVFEMNDAELTPKEYGLRIKTHTTMIPTAANKMRSATKLKIGLSGQRIETTRFDVMHNNKNLKVTEEFLKLLSKMENVRFELVDDYVPVYRNVDASLVLKFLRNYSEPINGYSKIINSIQYIEKLVEDSELINWTVVVSNLNGVARDSIALNGFKIKKARRKALDANGTDIRVLTSPSDFKYFFEDEHLKSKYSFGYKKGIKEIQDVFTVKNGLLVIYCFDISKIDEDRIILNKDLIGLGIWFPETTNENANIDYVVNSIYMDNQYYDEEKV